MRRNLLLGVVATVVVVVVGAVAVVALVLRTRSESGPVGTGVPVRSALVAADGRHLVVVGTGPVCSDPHLRVHEHDDSIELDLAVTPARGPCSLIVGTASRIVARTVLAHALGSRRLVDGASSAEVPYFDGRALWRVSYLPAGWKFDMDYPALDGDIVAPGKPAWVRRYVDTDGQLTISQSYGVLTDPTPGPVMTTVLVHGVAVPLHALEHSYSAVWTDGSMHFSLQSPPTGRGDPAMSQAQLVRVLAGLRK